MYGRHNRRGAPANYPIVSPEAITISHGEMESGEHMLILTFTVMGKKLGFSIGKEHVPFIKKSIDDLQVRIENGIREVQ